VSGASLLEVRDLSVRYRTRTGEHPAVRGVSLQVGRGEVVALVGESGSGKTTTAHAIVHLPAAGAVTRSAALRFDGLDLAGLTSSEWQAVRGRRIALIPQDPAVSLDPVKRVGAQVAEVLRIHRLAGRSDAQRRAIRLLDLAGIPEPALRARQYPHQLSGGMKQRVLIAAALAAGPELIVADEPTSALDVTVQKQILDHLGLLVRERNTAVLLITHDLAVAADRADRVLVMQHGRIVEGGAAAEVLEEPRHPYTRALVAAAPALSDTRLLPSPRVAPQIMTDDVAAPSTERADRPPLVVVRGVRKVFPAPGTRGGIHAVDGVDLEIRHGETFALVGESGSGKSTTARLIMRLEQPSAGTLTLGGVDYTRARGAELRLLRRKFQLVYQNPYASLDPRFSVSDLIEEPLRAYRVGTRAGRQATIARLLDEVALPQSCLRRLATEMSGGQRQRVAIARALALQPELVVLDEAVSALDVSVQAQILQLLTDLQAEYGLSYLFITHDLAVVRRIADRVAVMHRGRIVESGATSDVLMRPRNHYTRELIAAIPGHGRA
jgi:peptide/nickel transport system ATP-binding protein